MKRYFAISDIHGFYDAMMESLAEAGFQPDNPEHILIVCGDIFDRGIEPEKVYEFLKSLPTNRRVLIRGNHESLLKELVDRGFPLTHDIHNGTFDTIYLLMESLPTTFSVADTGVSAFRRLGIVDWIYGPEWVDYYELGRYIFVHGWIPVDTHGLNIFRMNDYHGLSMMEDWRKASARDWDIATWCNPIKMYQAGLVPKDRTMVCGHWRTSDFHKILGNCDGINDGIYISRDLIALDATTVRSGFCNVLVLDEGDIWSPVKGQKQK